MKNAAIVRNLLTQNFSSDPEWNKGAESLFDSLAEMLPHQDLPSQVMASLLVVTKQHPTLTSHFRIWQLPEEQLRKVLNALVYAYPYNCVPMVEQFRLLWEPAVTPAVSRYLNNDVAIFNFLLELPSLKLGWDDGARNRYVEEMIGFLRFALKDSYFKDYVIDQKGRSLLSSAVAKFFGVVEAAGVPVTAHLQFLEPFADRIGESGVFFPPTTEPNLEEVLVEQLAFKTMNRIMVEDQVRIIVPYLQAREVAENEMLGPE